METKKHYLLTLDYEERLEKIEEILMLITRNNIYIFYDEHITEA